MFRARIPVIAIAFVLLSLAVSAQNPNINPLPADSARINQLITQGSKFEDTSESLVNLAKQLRQLSTRTGNKRGLVYAQVFECHCYWMQADYPNAMKIGLHGITDAEKWHINDALPHLYAILANLDKETGNFDMAFRDNNKGINAARLIGDTLHIIALLGQQAMFTHSYYMNIHKLQDDHSSLEMEFEALKMAESQPKYEQLRIRFYDNIAQTYKESKNYELALFYGNKGAELAKKYKQPRSLTYSYCWLGQSYYYMGEHEKGIAYLNSAIAITQQLKQPFRQMELYQDMYDCYISSGNYKDALAAFKRSSAMRDSLQVVKSEKQINALQLKYDMAKKDKQIAYLDELNKLKSRKILWVMIGLPIGVILLFIILYQNFVINANSRVIKLKNEMLQQALDKIAYVQSHEIRKPLASIMGLMNIIKSDNYQADKEVLQKMDTAAEDLDQSIRDVIIHTETKTLTAAEERAAKW